MSLAVVIGAGIVAFIFLWVSFKLDNEKQQFLKVLLVLFGFGLLFIIPSATVFEEQNCYLVVNETEDYYQYGSNLTGGHWDQYVLGDEPTFNPSDDVTLLFHVFTYQDYEELCFNHENGSKTFFRAQALAYSIIILYLIVFLFVMALRALNNSFRNGKNRR